MHGIDVRKGPSLLLTIFFLVAIGPLWAGGSAESEESAAEEHHDQDHEHEDDHEDHDDDHDDHHEGDHDHAGEMAIPHIDAADLADGESLRVVASTSIVGDVVTRIAGPAAAVDVLMPRGQNPHAYEPTPRAIATVEDSYIAFVNGLNLEEALMETLENVAGSYVVPVSAGIPVLFGSEQDHEHDEGDHHDDEHDHADDHDHAGGDSHFWFDPTNVVIWAENIAEVLTEADPANRATYASNRDAYIAELEALDLEVRNQVASIPRNRRKLVVDHVSFGYFAEEYGFQIIGEVIPTVSDQAEPSAQHIAQLSEVIEAEDVSVIVVGSTAGRGLRNLVNAVAEDVGREVRIVEILTGSLAQAGSRGDSYLDFIRYNTEQIVSGLSR